MLAQFRLLINRYAKPYLVLVCLLWLVMFFVRWDTMVLGYNLYFLVMQKAFLILGILTILMGAISKRWRLILFGLLFCGAFWIDLFILFGILPVFGN
ncbi:hypothetical protein ACQ0P7_01385 [Streptococcus canis]|uniref:hypothetical protein n=1 Tax=Streptococcus canis TaxID=1329 RepID=UPI001330C89C|nr:hypothetical protein [Streptococcus canis]